MGKHDKKEIVRTHSFTEKSPPAGLANYIDTGLLFILAVYGIWLLRSSKHEEINSIWNEIWRC